MKWRVSTFVMALVLVGCSNTLNPTVKMVDSLQAGEVQTCTVGESMVEKGTLTVLPGFVAKASYHLPPIDGVLFPMVRQGATFVCRQRLGNGDLLCQSPAINQKDVLTVAGQKIQFPVPFLIFDPQEGDLLGIYYAQSGHYRLQDDLPTGLFRKTDVALKGSFKEELVYTGKNRDTINITYKEFSGDLETPLSSKKMQYDLTGGMSITFNDKVIEILDADENSIRFRVRN